MTKSTHPGVNSDGAWSQGLGVGYSADLAPRAPVLKLSRKRTVFFSRGMAVPPDCMVGFSKLGVSSQVSMGNLQRMNKYPYSDKSYRPVLVAR